MLILVLALSAPLSGAQSSATAGDDATPSANVRLDLNRATAAELQRIPGIGATRASWIVRIRESNGPFRSVDELRAMPRLSEKSFQRLRRHVLVSNRAEPATGYAAPSDERPEESASGP